MLKFAADNLKTHTHTATQKQSIKKKDSEHIIVWSFQKYLFKNFGNTSSLN